MAEEKASRFHYDPSVAAAVVASVAWVAVSGAHLYQAISYKTRYLIPMMIFVILEAVGYITRILAIKNPGPLLIFILSEVSLVMAPAFLAAQYYMVIGRVMSYVGSEFSLVRHSRITKVFVSADVFCILTQSTGGAMLSSADTLSGLKLAKNILLVGLIIQLAVFGIFFFLAIWYDIKSTRGWEGKITPNTGNRGLSELRPFWWAFYVGAVCSIIRCVYRTIEFGSINFELGGSEPDGYILTHEWCLYVFDTVMIIIAAIAYNIYHPGAYLPTKKGARLDGGFEDQPGRRKYFVFGPRGPGEGSKPLASSSSSVNLHRMGAV